MSLASLISCGSIYGSPVEFLKTFGDHCWCLTMFDDFWCIQGMDSVICYCRLIFLCCEVIVEDIDKLYLICGYWIHYKLSEEYSCFFVTSDCIEQVLLSQELMELQAPDSRIARMWGARWRMLRLYHHKSL